VFDKSRRLAKLDERNRVNLLSREARLREDDAFLEAQAIEAAAIAKIEERCPQEWDDRASRQWSAAKRKAALAYSTVLLEEYMKLGKSEDWLRRTMEDELSSWALTDLEKRAVMSKLLTVRIGRPRQPDEHGLRVRRVEAEAQRRGTTAWDVVRLSRATYYLWKGKKPKLAAKTKTSTDTLIDRLP